MKTIILIAALMGGCLDVTIKELDWTDTDTDIECQCSCDAGDDTDADADAGEQ